MKTCTRYFTQTALAAVFAVASQAVLAGPPAHAKGPRASIAAATVCALDAENGYLTVTTRLTDKSSGNETPVVTLANFDGLAKTATGNWDSQVTFDSQNGTIVGLNDIVVNLDLCNSSVTAEAKALNAMATITYDRSSLGDARTIENMCSDDPSTDEVEPAGIKLTDADRALIASVCGF